MPPRMSAGTAVGTSSERVGRLVRHNLMHECTSTEFLGVSLPKDEVVGSKMKVTSTTEKS